MLLSMFLGLTIQISPRAWSQENCNQGALGPATRSGLVTQVGGKPVLRDPINLPSCGKTVSEFVVEARGHDLISFTLNGVATVSPRYSL